MKSRLLSESGVKPLMCLIVSERKLLFGCHFKIKDDVWALQQYTEGGDIIKIVKST